MNIRTPLERMNFSFSIAKKIVVDADNTLIVKDDITVNFIKHQA